MGFWVLLLWKRVPVREVFGRPPEALWCLILFIEHFVEPFICDRIFYKLKQTNKSSISMIVFNVFFKSKIGLITMRIQDLYLPLYIVWGEDENQEALLPFYTLTSMKVVIFGWYCDIWLILWYLADIVIFRWYSDKADIVIFGWYCDIWLILWYLVKIVILADIVILCWYWNIWLILWFLAEFVNFA